MAAILLPPHFIIASSMNGEQALPMGRLPEIA